MITFSKLGSYGRLGNQLWQIASTIGIAIKNNTDYVFPAWNYSDFFVNRLPTFEVEHCSVFKEPSPYYNDIVLDNNINWNLEGYFQSWKYFENCKETVRNYFIPNFLDEDFSIDRVAIHVRRGDYTSLSHVHNNLQKEYYIRAMDMFPNDKFLVFTDDLDFVMNCGWFELDRCAFKTSEKAYGIETEVPEDLLHMMYMSRCKSHILANSSFSWWAAFIGNKDKVIYPTRWVVNEYKNDRALPEWIGVN